MKFDSWPSTTWDITSISILGPYGRGSDNECGHLRYRRHNHFHTLHICKIQKLNVPFFYVEVLVFELGSAPYEADGLSMYHL